MSTNQPLLKSLGLADFPVSQGFGVPNRAYKSRIHNGTDIACPVGTPIFAPVDGVVIQTWHKHESMGNALLFRCELNGSHYELRMLHLSYILHAGKFAKGEVMALSGNTGFSTGAHVHLEVWKGKYETAVLLRKSDVLEHLVDVEELLVTNPTC